MGLPSEGGGLSQGEEKFQEKVIVDPSEHPEPAPSAVDPLVAELREQIVFLREELGRARREAEEARHRMESYQTLHEKQLAAKDEQINRLLSLIEGHWAKGPVGETPQVPSESTEGWPRTPPESEKTPLESEEMAASTEKKDFDQEEASRPLETLRQHFKSSSDVCPFLRGRHDHAVFRGYPSANNVCWSPQVPKSRDRPYGSIHGDHQATYCLNENHTQCEYFAAGSEGTPQPAILEEPKKPWWSRKG